MPAAQDDAFAHRVSLSSWGRRCAQWGAASVVVLLSGCAPMQATHEEAAVAPKALAPATVQSGNAFDLLANMAPLPLRPVQDPAEAVQDLLDDEAVPDVDQLGVASWYGPGFHGRKTANGERFNQYELTAAHRQYAFNTQLCVRNASSGKTVVVRVNDRGPYAGNRVIDLSKAAAEEIGMLESGIKKVEIYKLDEGQEECHPALLQAQR